MDHRLFLAKAAQFIGWPRLALAATPPAGPTPPAKRDGWQATMFADVGEFLFGNALEPTPDNYDLAWQYRGAINARLVAAVRTELETEGFVSADAAERIFVDSAGPVNAAALAALADRMKAQVQDVARIAQASGSDVAAFANTLETQCHDGGQPETIVQLARSMVARTRVAEAQLRRSARELAKMRATLAEAQHSADTDPLTEIANRRAFKRTLEAALEAAKTSGRPLTLAFCDIDRFKALNDAHGHDVGDRVLRFVAKLLSQTFDRRGTVGRFGGEEFVVLLPGVPAATARILVDACRADLAGRSLVSADESKRLGSITFSAGIAEAHGSETMADLLRRADEALYRAKNSGRNRVEIG